MNQKQTAPPLPITIQQIFNFSLTKEFDELSLVSRACTETQINQESIGSVKSKPIFKNNIKNNERKGESCGCKVKKKLNTIKKIKYLENRIMQLERQNALLRRKQQNCFNCHREYERKNSMMLTDQYTVQRQELLHIIGDDIGHRHHFDIRHSHDSVEFESIDFSQSLAYKNQMDDKAWIMIGALMMAIGSKNMDIDGTVNTFKLLSDCVDSVRRQVQKSATKISLDFYCLKEEMKESLEIQGIDFDPFFNHQEKTGFQLESVKLETAQPFELVYDQKYTFSANYEALIAAVEHLKENCWISV